jgi:hypothetical protein
MIAWRGGNTIEVPRVRNLWELTSHTKPTANTQRHRSHNSNSTAANVRVDDDDDDQL